VIRFFHQIRQRLITNNKFSKYLLYAIGEILLVVIGILIALQIDNWNEQRKNNIKVAKYTEGLITDLKKDRLLVVNVLEDSRRDIEEINSYRHRLTAPSASLDTVCQIVRYEFNPLLSPNTKFNDNTYNVLVSTGHIALLDQSLAESLNSLYSSENAALTWTNLTFETYRNLGAEFMMKFPLRFRSGPMSSGPLNDLLWNTADKKELASQFNAVLVSRMAHNRVTLNWFEPVLKEIDFLLEELNKN
jgi:hypothetical protein